MMGHADVPHEVLIIISKSGFLKFFEVLQLPRVSKSWNAATGRIVETASGAFNNDWLAIIELFDKENVLHKCPGCGTPLSYSNVSHHGVLPIIATEFRTKHPRWNPQFGGLSLQSQAKELYLYHIRFSIGEFSETMKSLWLDDSIFDDVAAGRSNYNNGPSFNRGVRRFEEKNPEAYAYLRDIIRAKISRKILRRIPYEFLIGGAIERSMGRLTWMDEQVASHTRGGMSYVAVGRTFPEKGNNHSGMLDDDWLCGAEQVLGTDLASNADYFRHLRSDTRRQKVIIPFDGHNAYWIPGAGDDNYESAASDWDPTPEDNSDESVVVSITPV